MTWLSRYSRFVAVSTFFLIIAGGLVTSQDYGLAVPDWPKSYGMWMPPMEGGVLFEHGHRMIAAFVGLLTVILAVWLWLKEPRKWVRVLGMIAVLAVITQGVLGGVTVLLGLAKRVSVVHATLAQTFFAIMVILALVTSRDWRDGKWEGRLARDREDRFPYLVLGTTILIYLQLILGAWMRHSEAAMAIPDFPLAFGRLVPPFANGRIVIHFAHRCNALLILILISWDLIFVLRNYRLESRLVRPAILWMGLVIVQITLGAFAIWTYLSVPVVTSHVAVGALILATGIILTMRAFRLFRTATGIHKEQNSISVSGVTPGGTADLLRHSDQTVHSYYR